MAVRSTVDGLTLAGHEGVGMVLLAFDLDPSLTAGLAGFAVSRTGAGGAPQALLNRLTFEQRITAATTPDERRWTPSDAAPFQKFRWVDFPPDVATGATTYRATAMYFAPRVDRGPGRGGRLRAGLRRGVHGHGRLPPLSGRGGLALVPGRGLPAARRRLLAPRRGVRVARPCLRGHPGRAQLGAVRGHAAGRRRAGAGPAPGRGRRREHLHVWRHAGRQVAPVLQAGRDDGQPLADFAYLAAQVPAPFRKEWSGGSGIVIHHKFVVVDFNDAQPAVFTGSSNLSEGAETENGDNLLAITDPAIATAYAIEALRLFDHYHFRDSMRRSSDQAPLTLQGPGVSSPWWQPYYVARSMKERDRLLFAGA